MVAERAAPTLVAIRPTPMAAPVANPPASPPGAPAGGLAAPQRDRLGEMLVKEGLITREQLAAALQEQQQSGTRLGFALVKLNLVSETDVVRMLARQFRIPAVDISKFEVDPKIAKLIPSELATKHTVLPLKRDGRTLTVAFADPNALGVIDDLKFITRYDIFPVLAGEYTMRQAIEKHYEQPAEVQMQNLLQDVLGEDLDDVEVIDQTEDEVAITTLQAQVDEAPVVKLINAILTDAVNKRASDIHFECFEHELRVRYRIDGALAEVMKPPIKLKAALISRFKIMASLNIAERRVPQDGRIKLKVGKKVIDYRVSTLPTLFGEKVVLRILDKGNLTLDLETFGIEPRPEAELMEAIANPYGMVLVTGPTGSGKTTTLYSALSKINTIDSNIMTAEDPVEYNLYGINQVLVRNEIGMSFAAALKAFLRQDPNVIMLGEIRDLETGGIAIKAALTGHLVLSTLHTNSAPETIVRLLDMGLEPFNVASALNAILAQRLVRRVCAKCKTKYTPDDAELAGAKVKRTTTMRELRFTEEALQNARKKASAEAKPHLEGLSLDTTIGELPFFKGAGCEACAGTGLKGRQGVYEVMFATQSLKRLIMQSADVQTIRDHAIEGGMLTLRMDGWLKVLKGVVPLEQIIRETSA
jgi:type IV pilus assembly protein PilB